MPTHFSAFISYRHCPQDAAIAGRIQRQLEHFRVPGAIRRSTGIKKIDRIFRDKEELPLSSNLGDDIDEALRNSDFLIVICSPRLKESVWCQREIALFLETHPVDHVLTVLAEGEPQDVVPEILLRDREPLSCDYRMSPRKAKQIELPRLAAAILGCRYDDLRQRQKQYRTRQLTALLSVFLAAAVALSVYFYRTSREIQKNYEQALRNQSQFLSSEALELLEDGDRLTAISLALEALPSGDDPRPWIPEAEYALSRAVNAYGSSAEILAVNAFSHKGSVIDYFISPDGEYLVSWDAHAHIYVWDTQTFSLLHTFDPGMELDYAPVLSAPDHRMIIGDFDTVRCFDYLSGQLVWENTNVCGNNLLLSADCSTLATSFYAGDGTASLLDAATGEAVHTIPILDSLPDSYSVLNPACFSPDGSYLALKYGSSFDGQTIIIYSLATQQMAITDFTVDRADSMCFTEDNRLIVSGEAADSYFSMSMLAYGYTSLVQDRTDLYCLDPDTAQVLWDNYFNFYLVFFQENLITVDYPMADGTTKEVICCTYANVCVIMDPENGTILQRLELPASSVTCEYEAGSLYWYLTSGEYCVHTLGTNSVYSFAYFPGNLVDGKTNYGFYVRTHNATQILLYQAVTDTGWSAFENDVPMDYSYQVAAISDRYMVVKPTYGSASNCYDLRERKYLQTLEIDSAAGQQILGFAPDGVNLVISDLRNGQIILLDLATGESIRENLPFQPSGTYNAAELYDGIAFLWNGKLAYGVKSFSSQVDEGEDGSYTVVMSEDALYELYVMDLRDKTCETCETYELLTASSGQYMAPTVTADAAGTHLMISTTSYDESFNTVLSAQVLNVKTGQRLDLRDLPQLEYGQTLLPAWTPDGRLLALRGTDSIRILSTADGSVAAQIPNNGLMPVSTCFTPDGQNLLVLYSDTSLCRYSTTGQLLNRLEVYFYTGGLSAYNSFAWQFTDHGLMVTADQICTLVDTEAWAPYTYVRQCLHYDEAADTFYVTTSADGGYVLASYPRYTTEALIERAHEILGSNRLTEEQRDKYGLD